MKSFGTRYLLPAQRSCKRLYVSTRRTPVWGERARYASIDARRRSLRSREPSAVCEPSVQCLMLSDMLLRGHCNDVAAVVALDNFGGSEGRGRCGVLLSFAPLSRWFCCSQLAHDITSECQSAADACGAGGLARLRSRPTPTPTKLLKKPVRLRVALELVAAA